MYTTPFSAHTSFEDELPLWSAPFGLQLLQHIHYRKNIMALDIGFGTGFPLIELAMRLGESARVFGIDPWEAGLKRTAEKIRFYGITNVQLINGQAEQIPLANQSIDLITSNNGLNNVSDLAKAISECSRIIKNGGQFIQTLNLAATMKEFYQVMEKTLTHMHLTDEREEMHRHIYEKRKPLQEITDILMENRFSVKNIINDEFEYRFTDGTTMLNHYFIRTAFASAWRNIAPSEREHEVFAQIEHTLNRTASEKGHIRLTVPFVLIDCEKMN